MTKSRVSLKHPWQIFRRFFRTRARYDSKAVTTYNCCRLLQIAGDVELNPGPTTSSLQQRKTRFAAGQRLAPRPPRVVSGAFRVRPATLSELSSALNRMQNSKSSGADGITVGMLKQTFPVIAPHLLRIVNGTIRTGKLPEDWKAATVTPLFKSGDVSDVQLFPARVCSAYGVQTRGASDM